MKLEVSNKQGVKRGFAAGFPVFVGYFPVAVAFGILSKTTGLSVGDSVAFSVLVFAGASQFMALNLIKAGAAFSGIIFATLLLNLRHLLMSASLAAKIAAPDKRWLPAVAFGVTDETFAVSATNYGPLGIPFLLALEGTAYLGWVGGTLMGYLAGSILPA
ncbi:MAG: AzlC family ABC transporter permease, partial [Bacteroidota bacterium]